jgi:hypothetical protein
MVSYVCDWGQTAAPGADTLNIVDAILECLAGRAKFHMSLTGV